MTWQHQSILLKIYERLRSANLDEKAAKEIAEVLKESTEDRFLTRKDLDDALSRLESKLISENIKWSLLFWIGQLAAMIAIFKFFIK